MGGDRDGDIDGDMGGNMGRDMGVATTGLHLLACVSSVIMAAGMCCVSCYQGPGTKKIDSKYCQPKLSDRLC